MTIQKLISPNTYHIGRGFVNLFRKMRRKRCIRIRHPMLGEVMWKQTLPNPILPLCLLFPRKRAGLVCKFDNTEKAKAQGLQYNKPPAREATAKCILKPSVWQSQLSCSNLAGITDPCGFWLYLIKTQGGCRKSIIWTQILPPILNNYMIMNELLFLAEPVSKNVKVGWNLGRQ